MLRKSWASGVSTTGGNDDDDDDDCDDDGGASSILLFLDRYGAAANNTGRARRMRHFLTNMEPKVARAYLSEEKGNDRQQEEGKGISQ